MKIKTLKKLLITFSAIPVVSIGIVLACVGDDGSYYGYSNFTPETFVDPEYEPFLYAPYEMFYDGGYDDIHCSRFNNEIQNDWKTFLKGKITGENLNFFLLSEKSDPVIEELYKYVSQGTKSVTYNIWSSKIDLQSEEVKSFLEFMYWAKKVEKSSLSTFSYWDYEQKEETPKVESSVIEQIKVKYNLTKDSFLKNRYWFQVMKAYFYSDSRDNALSFFEKTNKSVPRNTLYYRALAYLAGISYKSGDYSNSNYLYSIAFENCPQLRKTMMYNFHPQSESDWNGALNLAKNAKEKVTLWALLGYYNDEARAIREIYKLDPKSPYLEYLISRYINKNESDGYGDYKSLKDLRQNITDKVDMSFINLVEDIARGEKTRKPYLWYTAAGYLQTLLTNYKKAKDFYDKAGEVMPKNQLAKNQLRLLKFINTLSEMEEINSGYENNLLSDMKWLYIELPNSSPDNFRYSKAIDWSKNYLAKLYESQNNVIMSEIFHPVKAFYPDNEKIEHMKMFLEKPSKTPYEKLAEEIYCYSIGDIYEYQAVIATFKNDANLALELMSKASGKDVELLGNPFNGFIKDCHDCDHAAPQKTKFSKYRFVEIIKIMKEKVEKGEDLYNNYLLLGNAFYSMTFYGNARVFYEGDIIGSGAYAELTDDFSKMHVDMTNAKYYYKKALEAASNDEQRAKCTYLLAKCERNEYYNDPDDSRWGNVGHVDFLAWDGFKKLKSKYSNTKYYRDVIKECDYFKKYVGN